MSVFEIVGGAYMLGFTLLLVLLHGLPSPLSLIASLSASSVAIAAGVQLWRGEPRGRTASIVLLALQAFFFAFAPRAFSFYILARPAITLHAGFDVEFSLAVGGELLARWRALPDFDEPVAGINLLAVVMLTLLRRARPSHVVQVAASPTVSTTPQLSDSDPS